MHNIKVHVGDN